MLSSPSPRRLATRVGGPGTSAGVCQQAREHSAPWVQQRYCPLASRSPQGAGRARCPRRVCPHPNASTRWVFVLLGPLPKAPRYDGRWAWSQRPQGPVPGWSGWAPGANLTENRAAQILKLTTRMRPRVVTTGTSFHSALRRPDAPLLAGQPPIFNNLGLFKTPRDLGQIVKKSGCLVALFKYVCF